MKSSHTRRPLHQQNTGALEKKAFFSKTPEKDVTQDADFFQTKLAVGDKDDKHEKEANTVADKVQKKTEEQKGKPSVQKKEDEKKGNPIMKMDKNEEKKPIQKMSALDKKKEKALQKKEMPGNAKDEQVMKAAKHETAPHGAHKLSIEERIKQNRGKGHPLPDDVRKHLESEIGADFSQVVIHTDSESIAMSNELHALAFTNGFDIYFNAGQYQPHSPAGQKLLVHELTHVVQQTGVSKKSTEKKK